MVDSEDIDRISEAALVLLEVLEEMNGVPAIVFANKQDLPCKFS